MIAPEQRARYGDEGRQLLAEREAAHSQRAANTHAPAQSTEPLPASFARAPPSQLRAPTGGTEAHARAQREAVVTADKNGWGMVAPEQRAAYGEEGRRLLAEREAAYNATISQQRAAEAAVAQENDSRHAKVRGALSLWLH